MSNLGNGLALLALGMGFVLAFLCILIFLMTLMSKVVLWLNKIFPETIEDAAAVAKKVSANVDEAIAVAIAAIMSQRRQ